MIDSDASKSGVAQETINNADRRSSKAMTVEEARLILGVTEEAKWEDIAQVVLTHSFPLACLNLLVA